MGCHDKQKKQNPVRVEGSVATGNSQKQQMRPGERRREDGRNERSGGRRIRTNCEDEREHTPLFLSREPSCDGGFSAVAVKERGERERAVSISARFNSQTEGVISHTPLLCDVRAAGYPFPRRYLVFICECFRDVHLLRLPCSGCFK